VARGRRTGFPVARSRRITLWEIGFGGTQTTLTANGKIAVQGLAGIGGGGLMTLIRQRGELVVSASFSTLGDSASLAAGIILVTDDAFAIGTTAIPGPISDAANEGWIWHQFCSINSRGVIVAAASGAQSYNFRFAIDSKAMRRWDLEEQTLTLVFEMADEVGVITADLAVSTRTLLLQP